MGYTVARDEVACNDTTVINKKVNKTFFSDKFDVLL